jgi:hypothetical protein
MSRYPAKLDRLSLQAKLKEIGRMQGATGKETVL